MLEIADLTVRYGEVAAVDRVSLDLPAASVLALLGPSGCGKSTLLRAIAGLEPLASGRVSLDGVDLAPIPVHRRGFGLMFQDGVLFPHASVGGNIAYGLRRKRMSRTGVRLRVDEMLDLVGLSGYQDRRVATLSGGEAQRVALARALAPEPRLLLLDEPLAALDRALRERLLPDLRRVLTSTATAAVFVTHDQAEAFAIADTVSVMRAGRIRQSGTPREVWATPADEWVARFVGYTSVLAGNPDGDRVRTAVGTVPGAGGSVALRPAALVAEPGGTLRATCTGITAGPDGFRLEVDLPGVGAASAISADGSARIGAEVWLRFDPSGAAVLPPDGGAAGGGGAPAEGAAVDGGVEGAGGGPTRSADPVRRVMAQ